MIIPKFPFLRWEFRFIFFVFINTGEGFTHGFKLWYRWITERREIHDL